MLLNFVPLLFQIHSAMTHPSLAQFGDSLLLFCGQPRHGRLLHPESSWRIFFAVALVGMWLGLSLKKPALAPGLNDTVCAYYSLHRHLRPGYARRPVLYFMGGDEAAAGFPVGAGEAVPVMKSEGRTPKAGPSSVAGANANEVIDCGNGCDNTNDLDSATVEGGKKSEFRIPNHPS